jgi:NLI interacting factor-like phosphatase
MSSQKNGAASPAARNNYSAPHTPIASAKRPRASLDKSMLSPAGGSAKSSVVPSTPLIHEDEVLVDDEADVDAEPDAEAVLSPMHKPKPLVVKASDAEAEEQGIFSPMLHLSDHDDPEQAEGDDDDPRNGSGTQGKHDHEGYDDEALDQPEQVDDVLVEDDGSSQGSIDEDEFNPYVFIKSLPPYNVVAPLRPPIALPQKDKDAPPISLVLDLDETLVHCSVEPVDDADLVFPVVFHGMTYQVNVRLRPHLFTFLERIKDKFEVIVFTASQQVYADELLNLIDPGKPLCFVSSYTYSSPTQHRALTKYH